MSTLLARSGKPYLSQLVPLVALVREQRFAPAQAGDAFSLDRAFLRLLALPQSLAHELSRPRLTSILYLIEPLLERLVDPFLERLVNPLVEPLTELLIGLAWDQRVFPSRFTPCHRQRNRVTYDYPNVTP